jgi:formate hydrogenlyase regulatory protein HycA
MIMTFPEKIPIERMDDYQTEYMGQMADGRLFWVYTTFLYTIPYKEIVKRGEDWKAYRREYCILFLFDKNGDLMSSQFQSEPLSRASYLDTYLKEWVAALGPVEYMDIEVKLFQVMIDGHVFGLVPNEEGKCIELQPSNTIAFYEPWDGAYHT